MENNKGISQNYHVSNYGGLTELDLTFALGSPNEHKPKLEGSKNVGGFTGGLRDSFSMNDQNSHDKNKGKFPWKVGQVNELGGSSSAPGRVVTNATLFRPLATHIAYRTGSNPSSFYEKLMSKEAFAVPFYNGLFVGYGKSCKFCGVKSTPLWRRGPKGPQTLCNACGLKYARHMKKGAE